MPPLHVILVFVEDKLDAAVFPVGGAVAGGEAGDGMYLMLRGCLTPRVVQAMHLS
jgi:hypothetical protein